MHTSVLVFNNTSDDACGVNIEDYHFDSNLEFELAIEKKDIEEVAKENLIPENYKGRLREFLEHKKLTPKQYLKQTEYYVEDEKGNLGFENNPIGRYDWNEIGGRWKNTLINKKGKKGNEFTLSEIDWKAILEDNKREVGEWYDKWANPETRGNFNYSNVDLSISREDWVNKKTKSGLATFFWNVLDEDDWVECENDEKSILEMIEKYKDVANDVIVTIYDCHC